MPNTVNNQMQPSTSKGFGIGAMNTDPLRDSQTIHIGKKPEPTVDVNIYSNTAGDNKGYDSQKSAQAQALLKMGVNQQFPTTIYQSPKKENIPGTAQIRSEAPTPTNKIGTGFSQQ